MLRPRIYDSRIARETNPVIDVTITHNARITGINLTKISLRYITHTSKRQCIRVTLMWPYCHVGDRVPMTLRRLRENLETCDYLGIRLAIEQVTQYYTNVAPF